MNTIARVYRDRVYFYTIVEGAQHTLAVVRGGSVISTSEDGDKWLIDVWDNSTNMINGTIFAETIESGEAR